jgi:hypothetical protein
VTGASVAPAGVLAGALSASAGASGGAGLVSAAGSVRAAALAAAFFAAAFLGAALPLAAVLAGAAFLLVVFLVVALASRDGAAGSAAGCSSRTRPSRSARRRTRSACASSIPEEWVFTPMPNLRHRSRHSLFVIPSSVASSWTRIFLAKTPYNQPFVVFGFVVVGRASRTHLGGSQCLSSRSRYGRHEQPWISYAFPVAGARSSGPGAEGHEQMRHGVRQAVDTRPGCQCRAKLRAHPVYDLAPEFPPAPPQNGRAGVAVLGAGTRHTSGSGPRQRLPRLLRHILRRGVVG